MKSVMGIDQHGTTYHSLGKHPRKTLLVRLDATKADKIYVDDEDGSKHVGYIIHGLWITLYNVEPWEERNENS